MYRGPEHFSIKCDRCGRVWDEPAPRATEPVREKSHRFGWKTVGDLDFCPECINTKEPKV